MGKKTHLIKVRSHCLLLKKESDLIPKKEKTTEADVNIMVSIDDNNLAITSAKSKTSMLHFDDVTEEPTEKLNNIENDTTSSQHRTMNSSNEITEEITFIKEK